jgi:hypothetical protein
VGFISFVSNVQARLNAGNGIFAANGSLIHDSIAQYNAYTGIWAGQDSTVRNCVSAVNQGTGILVDGAGIVHKNIAVSNGYIGIFAGPDATLITDNVSRLNGSFGIYQNTHTGKAGTGGHGGNLAAQNAGGTITGGTALGCNIDSLDNGVCLPP